MTDDWEQFSASPYQQQTQPDVPDPEAAIKLALAYSFLIFDWPDQLSVVNAMLLGGKKAIWFDLLGAGEIGLCGQDIQGNLNRQGVVIHARALYPIEGTIAAVIVVDAEKEAAARQALADMGVLLF